MTDKNYDCDRETSKRGIKKVLKIIGFVILGSAFCVLFGFVVMRLWNWIMPIYFGLKEVTYWQAVGIFILAKILFGGFGGGSSNDSGHSSERKSKKRRGPHIKSQFELDLFGKKIKKEVNKSKQANEDYDELYEKWWDEKGENSFNEYMKNKDNENTETSE